MITSRTQLQKKATDASSEYTGRIGGLSHEDLDLEATLSGGQVFRWSRDTDGAWRGMAGQRRIRLLSSENRESLWWGANGSDADEAEQSVRLFLRLNDANLPSLAEEWSRVDPLFADAWKRTPGIRILRQEPEECFFSFLCASVAPIGRIAGMLRGIADEAGNAYASGHTEFPGASALAQIGEERLRVMGLGFRAKRVADAACTLSALPADHLEGFRILTHAEAKSKLREFYGVGEKIADCVCLFALGVDGAVPVDVHIWRIACRYAPELRGVSLTSANYERAAKTFQDRFGPAAGWAQQTLFYRAAITRTKA